MNTPQRIKFSRHTVNKIFGGDLPLESSDERDPDAALDESEHENWLRDNVPPHHD
jgi:hypothetical protein